MERYSDSRLHRILGIATHAAAALAQMNLFSLTKDVMNDPSDLDSGSDEETAGVSAMVPRRS